MAEISDDAEITREAEIDGDADIEGTRVLTDAPDQPDEPDREDDRSDRNLKRALVALVIVAVLDQLTKWWAESSLELGSCAAGNCIDVVGPLRFNLHYNTGAAFSRGEGLGPIIALVAVAMSIYLLWLARSAVDRLSPLLFGAIAGGAVGNLIDRVFRADDGPLSGGVVDFIDFQFWPIFNVADAAIVVGIIVLVVHQMREGRRATVSD